MLVTRRVAGVVRAQCVVRHASTATAAHDEPTSSQATGRRPARLLDALPPVRRMLAMARQSNTGANATDLGYILADDNAARAAIRSLTPSTMRSEVKTPIDRTLIVECNAGAGLLTRHIANVIAADNQRAISKLPPSFLAVDKAPVSSVLMEQYLDVFRGFLQYARCGTQPSERNLLYQNAIETMPNMLAVRFVGNMIPRNIIDTTIAMLNDFYWGRGIFAHLSNNITTHYADSTPEQRRRAIFDSARFSFSFPHDIAPTQHKHDIYAESTETSITDTEHMRNGLYKTKATSNFDKLRFGDMRLAKAKLLCISDSSTIYRFKHTHFVPEPKDDLLLTSIQPILRYPYLKDKLSNDKSIGKMQEIAQRPGYIAKDVTNLPKILCSKDMLPSPQAISTMITALHPFRSHKLGRALKVIAERDRRSVMRERDNNFSKDETSSDGMVAISETKESDQSDDIKSSRRQELKSATNDLYDSIMATLCNEATPMYLKPEELDASGILQGSFLDDIANMRLVSDPTSDPLHKVREALADLSTPESREIANNNPDLRKICWEAVRFPNLTRIDIWRLTKAFLVNDVIDLETGKFRFDLPRRSPASLAESIEARINKKKDFQEGLAAFIEHCNKRALDEDLTIEEVLKSEREMIDSHAAIHWSERSKFHKVIDAVQNLYNAQNDPMKISVQQNGFAKQIVF